MISNLLSIVLISFNIIVIVNGQTIQCYQCDSTVENCKIITTASIEHLKDCPNAPVQGENVCLTLFEDNNTARKCVEDPTENQNCIDNPNCYPCDTEGCNDDFLLECMNCNSAADENCATLQEPLPLVERCSNVNEQCFVAALIGGATIRGCIAADDCDQYQNGVCESCKTDNCNNVIYPPGRLKCLQCNSIGDTTCLEITATSIASHSMICQNYEPNDSCFTIVNDRNVIRGCISDQEIAEIPTIDECTNSLFCYPCTGDDCNEDLPIQPLKCITCNSGVDTNCATVENPITDDLQCTKVTDQCFVGIGDNGITYRGCISENDETNCLGDLCLKCSDSDNCNSKQFPSDRLKCLKCNSSNEPECLHNPESLLESHSFTCPNYILDDYCYTFVTENREVHRGCISDQDVPEISDISKCDSESFCFKCNNAAGCNVNEIVPLNCNTCNSTADPNCATLRNTISTTETCNLIDDQCFVGIGPDGTTYRGCTSSINNVECPTGMCQKCADKNNCNEEIYPADRLLCHQCNEHVDCNGPQDAEDKYPCANYVRDDSCFIIGMGLYAQRGCISDDDEFKTNCTDNPNLCTRCNSDGCNNDDAVQTNVGNCYFCDQDNPFCYAHINNNTEDEPSVISECKIFLNYTFQCYTYRKGDLITRDCLNHVERISQPECNENSPNCKICKKDLCNDEPELKIGDSCISCTLTDNPDCNETENILYLTKDCYSYPGEEGCYHNILDNSRGCFTDLDGDILQACAANNEICKTCLPENCNQKLNFITCHECDSLLDENCVDVGNNSILCDDYLDSCLIYVRENNNTVRGCTNQLNSTADDKIFCTSWNCSECYENDCNTEMFPADRLKCLKCRSDIDLDCLHITDESVSLYSITCPNYVSDDSCYTIVNTDESWTSLNVTRGCISDRFSNDQAATACRNSDTYCVECFPRNNCNIRELAYEPSLSCIQCDQKDPKCEWGFHEDDAQPCTTEIFFDGDELCYTYQRGAEIKRGCVLDDDECLDNDESCLRCSSIGCNSLHLKQSQCIICDSRDIDEEFCNSEIEEGETITCSNGKQLYEYRGCYTYKIDERVRRGCVSALTEDELAYCQDANNLNCEICYDDGCNFNEPNFAYKLKYFSIIILICISLLTIFIK